ncbi:hypothetical protein [Agilicoccus flavus]|uniref:hypothetical protein n=1 Tax=Agilicoccus flavus TaxID=2775968 RepID=UPI001CF62DF2|nr:hypothetical protein [Agilicoccus flavus]
MPMTVADALTALDAAVDDGRIEQVCRAHAVELLVLFGSALHSPDPRDVDVAVGFGHGTARDLLGTIDALADLVPGDHLDVMDLDRAGPVARVEALVGCRILYEGRAGAFTEREMSALGEYLDTAYLRTALLRDLAR